MRKLFALILVCGLSVGCVPKMRDTTVPSSNDSYDKLGAEATKLGWKIERSETGSRDGKYFWMLKVTTAEGGKVFFTKNNRTGDIAFTCDGPLGGMSCEDAANKLFAPAFGGKY